MAILLMALTTLVVVNERLNELLINPILEGLVSVSAQGALVPLAEIEQGSLKPKRIFNLPR